MLIVIIEMDVIQSVEVNSTQIAISIFDKPHLSGEFNIFKINDILIFRSVGNCNHLISISKVLFEDVLTQKKCFQKKLCFSFLLKR